MKSNSESLSQSRPLPTRRQFITTSTAAVGSILAAPYVLSTRAQEQANVPVLRIGLIGCGGRGTGAAAQALTADKATALVAMADAFEDRLMTSLESLKNTDVGERVQVPVENRFVGFDAYQKLIDCGVDVVLLATPPGFRPTHLKAAIGAGKHVFSEKPMAVDAPGVRSVLETAAEAKRKNLSLVAGFCYRYHPGVRQLAERIHSGAIGDIRAIYTTYNTGGVWSKPRQPDWTDMQWQMRNWYYFTWLSGDHIVEQAVHCLDKMSWFMKDVPPVKCVAHGGRQVRTDPQFGHIYDHFSVVYEYENGARGFHFCRQQDNCFQDNSDYIMGADGIGRIVRAFSGPFIIQGKEDWRYREEDPRSMYQHEHDELFAGIRSGKMINDGEWMAHSTLIAIMGRMSAYTGQEITWEQELNSEESLIPAELDWNAPPPAAEVAMPGRTEFR